MRFVLIMLGLFCIVTSVNAQKSFTEYHKNGKIAFQGTKINDKLVGDCASYNKDGQLKFVARYNLGFLVQKKEYYVTGELKSTHYFIDGTSFFKVYYYFKSGKLEKEGKLDKDGLENGEWNYYSEDNELLKIQLFENGKVIG